MSGDPPQPPHPLAGTTLDVVLAEEDAIRLLRHEVAVWFDLTGHVIGRKSGGPSSLDFSPDEVVSMRDAIFTHNHPAGWTFAPADPRHAGSSFSDDDIALSAAADLAEIRVIGPLARFAARRPPDGWNVTADRARQQYVRLVEVVARELLTAYVYGNLTVEQMEQTFYHEVVRRLADQIGFAYERWEG